MVRFGESLQESRHEEWRYAYLSYDSLKEQLALIISISNESAKNPSAILEKIQPLKIMFQRHLESEIIKTIEFYCVTLESIQMELEDCSSLQVEVLASVSQSTDSSVDWKIALIDTHRERWRELASTAVKLLEFITLNMQALRKIVKKHSKNVEPLLPSANIGATRVFEITHPEEPGNKLVQATFLSDHYIKLLGDMQEHSELRENCIIIKRALTELHYASMKIEGCSPALSCDSEEIIVGSAQSIPRFGSLRLSDSLGTPGVDVEAFSPEEGSSLRITRRPSIRLWKRTKNTITEFEPILARLESAAATAQKEASLVIIAEEWFANQAAIFTSPPKPSDAIATQLGLFLNLLNTFLYMANYNLIIPFTASICETLKTSQSHSGIIIGAADISAMVAAVFYSSWTNHSFRHPLLFSALTLLVSNVLYCISLDYGGGLWLLITSRLVAGLGAARSLNRRYIADFVGTERRTLASAGFVAASSLGMAAGPFLASPLEKIPEVEYYGFKIHSVTMAGWCFVVVWVAFLVVATLFFSEPCRPKKDEVALDKESLVQPLALANGDDSSDKEDSPATFNFLKDASFFPTMLMVLVLFALKLEQQGAVSSVPIFTQNYPGWDESRVGLFLALMGIVVIPVNIFMGGASKYLKDRHQCLLSLALCLGGGMLMLFENPNGGEILKWEYFTSFTAIYIGTVVMEGAAMSLMSKVIAPQMAVGTFNTGLLATESGSFGRFLGNFGITLIGSAIHLDKGKVSGERLVHFGDIIYGIFASFSLLCILLLLLCNKRFKK